MLSKRAAAKTDAEDVDLALRLAPFFRPMLADFVERTRDTAALEPEPEIDFAQE